MMLSDHIVFWMRHNKRKPLKANEYLLDGRICKRKSVQWSNLSPVVQKQIRQAMEDVRQYRSPLLASLESAKP